MFRRKGKWGNFDDSAHCLLIVMGINHMEIICSEFKLGGGGRIILDTYIG